MSYGIQLPLTKENLKDKIDSYNIFKKYCPGFEELGKAFPSPLRDTDKNPSAFIIYWDGDLLFKDFGDASYRAISFVMKRYGLSFMEAMQKINADFDLGLKSDSNVVPDHAVRVSIPSEVLEEKGITQIAVKRRAWENHDNDYWHGRYRISRSTLEAFTVSPISNFTINDKLFFAQKYAYVYDYYWEDGVFRRKIYQPLAKYGKWYNNGGAVVQGEGMLPKSGDLLIITSSLKDVMTLYELGYTAIAPTSETAFLPGEYFRKQNTRFSQIILFMDSDEPGLIANKRLSDKWGLRYISIPISFPAKDISDFVWRYGQNEARRILTNLI